jgi:hypothetical protein
VVPTGAVQLPAVKLGATKVHVRVRSEVPGIFPSAWSGWQTVTLNAWTAPTGVTVGTLTNETAAVSWSLNTNTTDAVDVYVAPGSVAPSDWTPYRVNTLPEGTTSTLLTGLSASTAYIVGVAFRDRIANVAMTPVTATFTSAGTTTGTATTPIAVQVIAGVNDASLPQGIVLALYSAAGAVQTVIERSTTSGSGFAEIAVVPAESTSYVDYLPKDGTTYYYRLKHRAPGQADSAATAEASGTASGVNVVVVPSFSAPSLKVVTTPGTSSYDLVVTWDGTIVYNLDGVSQSVSGWNSPRTVNVTRNDYLGSTKVAAFAVTKTGVTVSESVNVPPKDSSSATLTIGNQTADDVTDDYEFSWTASGFPTGTTYDLLWTATTTAGVTERGYDDNATSPVTVASGYNIGASPTYSMTVTAIKNGVVILSKSRTGTFLT